MITRRTDYIFIVLGIFLLVGSMFLYQENLGRSVFFMASVIVWLGISIWLKSFVIGGLLTLVAVFPFNVTLQLPFEWGLYDPYVGGVFLNYLAPYFSVIDVFIGLIIVAACVDLGRSGISITTRAIFVATLAYFVFHNIVIHDFITVFATVRVLFYLSATLLIADWLGVCKEKVADELLMLAKRLFVGLLTFGILIQGFIGFSQFRRGASLGWAFLGESQIANVLPGVSFVDLGGNLYLRAYGTFPHPNLLAGFMICSFIVFSWMIIRGEVNKLLGGVILVAISGITVLTLSRVALAVIVVFWILIIARWIGQMVVARRARRHLNELKMAKLTQDKDEEVTRLAAVSPALLFERFSNTFSGSDISVNDRWGLMVAGLKMISEYPIFGSGIGLFTKRMLEFAPSTSNGLTLLQPVHNIFILLIAENGVLFGSAFVILLLWYQVISFLKAKSKLIATMVIIFIISVGMFDHYLVTLPQGLALFFSALLILKLNQKYPTQKV